MFYYLILVAKYCRKAAGMSNCVKDRFVKLSEEYNVSLNGIMFFGLIHIFANTE